MIIVDAMNGARSPEAPVAASLTFSQEGRQVTLLGDADAIERELRARTARPPATLSVIGTDDPLTEAARRVADGQARAMVSAAAIPAVVTAGAQASGPLAGVTACAAAGVFATPAAPVTVLDLGATATPTPAELEVFGRLGTLYARVISSREAPRVGLLTPEHPDGPTLDRIREADRRLAAAEPTYAGCIDGTRIFSGDIDVVVTDGFTGQLLVETIEGLVGGVERLLRDQIRGHLLAGAGALLLSRLSRSFGQKMAYVGAGAAAVLGLAGHHFVVHARSGEKMWVSALRTADGASQTSMLTAFRGT